MRENLVIVESPAKAKTIERFLGNEFTVLSSYGHIRDLSKKNLGIDIENGFEPIYLISEEKKKVVTKLKSEAKKATTVWLASDEDREGEAIAWHLKEALELDDKKTKRIVFSEITKDAITNAIANPREVDMNLVEAQQARRILDRIVGFELSPVLWRKVKPKLSAGRVQSVALRLIVDREREIQKFAATSSYRVEGLFFPQSDPQKREIKAELTKRFKNEEEALALLEKSIGAIFVVEGVEEKKGKRSPAPPFTTSTLQQEASRKLGFSLNQTMRVAQSLYESGHITYMRTDSLHLSKVAIAAAKGEIVKLYGENYSKSRQFATKSKGAQEAHEAIRPTYLSNSQIDGTHQEQRLYSLIYKRTLASQMADASILKQELTIKSNSFEERFKATAESVLFDGFLKLYIESDDEEQEQESNTINLPNLKSGEVMEQIKIDAVERFSKRPSRYSEASLVKKLEELGIGRPSTYAPTISTLSQRGYMVRESRPGVERSYRHLSQQEGKISKRTRKERWGGEKRRLFPEDIGILVNDFLVEHFDSIVDYNFTAQIEEQFDKIALGEMEWDNLIDQFYHPFKKMVDETLESSKPTNAERVLGDDPKSGKPVSVRIGRFGPLAQIGAADDEEKKFASLRKGQLIETITLEEALKLFELPREVGVYKEEPIIAAIGRYGPYLRFKGKFVSIDKEDDPNTISLERSIELIDAHFEKEAKKKIASFPEIDAEILNGRYGPYIKAGKMNVRIPKGVEPSELTQEEVEELIANHSKRGKGKRGGK